MSDLVLVRDLIAALNEFPPTATVLVSRDAEGNSFHYVDEVSFPTESRSVVVIWPDDNWQELEHE